jgi:ArsR family transcriptional regulator
VAAVQDIRWHLYRLLADPVRLRLLALAQEAELSVGEIAELVEQTQPNVSRHAGLLRQAGLLSDRRNGTRTFLRLANGASSDPVVLDALAEGRRMCAEDGSLERVPEVVRSRDAMTREFFDAPPEDAGAEPGDLAAYLYAFGGLSQRRGTAVDAGTGDGTALDLLAPLFERVVAVDRSEVRLAAARSRTEECRYGHVEFVCGEVDGPEVRRAVGAGADLAVAGRVLHHAPEPAKLVASLADLLVVGGRLLVVDYGAHADETMRETDADVWLGFEPKELLGFASHAGLGAARVVPVPTGFWTTGRKSRRRVPWLALVATKTGVETTTAGRRTDKRRQEAG